MNRNILKGSFFIIFIYGSSQILRLSANLIVTRLLDPGMFGILAVITVILQGMNMFTDVGLNSAIIRSSDGLKKSFLNTAWSLQIIRGWLIFIVILIIAGLILLLNNNYPQILKGVYSEPNLPLYMSIVGISAVISGYGPMSPAIAIRKITVGRIESIELTSQLLGITIMIFIAWLYHSIWALVITPIIIASAKTIFVYMVFKDKHKFEIDRKYLTEIYGYGKWIFLSSILTFLSMQGDRLLFGYYLTAEMLGYYTIAYFLASALTELIIKLSQNIWFPHFSNVNNTNRNILRDVYYDARFKFDAIVGIICGFLIITGNVWVGILYDERYSESGILLQILSLSLLGNAISAMALECLSSIGNTKISAKVMMIRSIIIFAGIPLAFVFFGFYGSIILIAINVYITLPFLYYEMHNHGLFIWQKETRSIIFLMMGLLAGMSFIKYFFNA